MARIAFFILLMSLFPEKLLAQNGIEKYLADKKLITSQQLKKYYQKKNSEDSDIKAMIKLLKNDKTTRSYALKMEKEYKAEQAKKMKNKDTLAILLAILQPSCEQEYPFEKDTLINDKKRHETFSEFIKLLAKNHLITIKDAEKINNSIKENKIYDSCRLVSLAINHKNIAFATTRSKLLVLMGVLRTQKILSEKNYQKLITEQLPDTISKITYILSHCEKIFINNWSPFLNDKKDFFSRISTLGNLANLDLSDVKLDFITLHKDSGYLRAIPIIKAEFKGRQFIHECYEVATSQKEFDPYSMPGHDYYRIYNRILSYNSSPHRMYEIKEHNPMQWIQGFIMLTAEQRSALYHIEQLELSIEDNELPLSSEQILHAIAIYKKSGLLKSVSNSSIDSVLAGIQQNPVFRYNELISRFESISVTVNDRIPLSESQAVNLLKKMAAISNYEFDPRHIRFEKDTDENLVLMFDEKNGTVQRHKFDSLIVWQDIWGLIHNVIYSSPGRKGYFQPLRFEQYKETFIYATADQMKILEKEKVINDY